MYRYVILAIYPILFVACATAAYQTRRLARSFPSAAWVFKRNLMVFFMLVQVYGAIRILAVNRVFTWSDPLYLIGVLAFCIGINQFDRLLLRDARGVRAKSIKVVLPVVSGDLPPEFWEHTFTEVVRRNIKPEYLTEAVIVTPPVPS